MLVVVYHTLKLVDPDWAGQRALGVVQCGYLAVDCFFVLSGFVLTHVYARSFARGFRLETYRDFLSARFARIYPLYVFVLGLWVLLEFFRPHPFVDPERGPFALLLHVLLVQDWWPGCSLAWNLPAWSISAEWAAYLAFPAFVLLQRIRTPAARTALGVAFWLALFTITRLVPWGPYRMGQMDVVSGFGVLRCAFEFALGVLTYEAFADRWLARWLSGDGALAIVAGFVLVAMQVRLRDPFIVLAFPLLILCIAHNTGNGARVLGLRPLRFLGDISYSIYLLHAWLREIVWMATPSLVGRPLWLAFSIGERAAFYTAFLAVVVALSAVTYRFVEVPMRVRLRSALGRRTAREADDEVAPSSSAMSGGRRI